MTVIDPAEYAHLVSVTEAHVRTHMRQFNDCSHEWSHVERVRAMALRIAHAENERQPGRVNLQIVELAALLHDVGDFKFLTAEKTSEAVLREFMQQAQYPECLQEAIAWIHGRISFRHELAHPDDVHGPHQAELFCVQDADRLEAIGAIGIARCFAYNGARNIPLLDRDAPPLVALTRQQYDQMALTNKSNARNHFYEKLLKIAAMVKTPLGREEAARRHALLYDFIVEFDRECGLDSSPLQYFQPPQQQQQQQ